MVRSLRNDDPNKWIENIFSKMQKKGHWNGMHVEEPCMHIPPYIKTHVRNWLHLRRLVAPTQISCHRKAHAWSTYINDKASLFYNKAGGLKCHLAENTSDWFIAAILKSVAISYEIQSCYLREHNYCCDKKVCYHDEELVTYTLCFFDNLLTKPFFFKCNQSCRFKNNQDETLPKKETKLIHQQTNTPQETKHKHPNISNKIKI